MKHFLLLTVLCFVAGTLTLSAADQTWTGKISDSKCGASHAAMKHEGKKTDDRDCTQMCVKDGAKYVFVSKGKVHEVVNQDFSGLSDHAGHTVKLTGSMDKDGKITVSNIEMPAKKKSTS